MLLSTLQHRKQVPVIPSGSSSNTPLGVTTTTTNATSVGRQQEVIRRLGSTEEIHSTTPFCLGCGAWVEVPEELNDSPWYYCEWCTPKKQAIVKVTKRTRKYPM